MIVIYFYFTLRHSLCLLVFSPPSGFFFPRSLSIYLFLYLISLSPLSLFLQLSFGKSLSPLPILFTVPLISSKTVNLFSDRVGLLLSVTFSRPFAYLLLSCQLTVRLNLWSIILSTKNFRPLTHLPIRKAHNDKQSSLL